MPFIEDPQTAEDAIAILDEGDYTPKRIHLAIRLAFQLGIKYQLGKRLTELTALEARLTAGPWPESPQLSPSSLSPSP